MTTKSGQYQLIPDENYRYSSLMDKNNENIKIYKEENAQIAENTI